MAVRYNPVGASTIVGTDGADTFYRAAAVIPNEPDLLYRTHTLSGTLDNDTYVGGGGDDWFEMGPGSDTIMGGEGRDRVSFLSYTRDVGFFGWSSYLVSLTVILQADANNANRPPVYSFGATSVTVDLQLSTYSQIVKGEGNGGEFTANWTFNGKLYSIEYVSGTWGNDRFLGSSLGDLDSRGQRVEVFEPGPGNDFIDGRGAVDRLFYSEFNFGLPRGHLGIIADFTKGTVRDPWGFTDTFRNIEEVQGSSLADVFIGNAGDQTFIGDAGNDTMNGGGGSDRLLGGDGNDNMSASMFC